MTVDFPRAPSLFNSPAYSQVAIVPPGATWVIVGGQNAVDENGAIVGGDDLAAQALQVRKNLEAALAAAGCDWSSVVRVIVYLKEGTDARKAFGVFQPALAGRAAPPLVSGVHVPSLVRPEFLLEVGLEAVR